MSVDRQNNNSISFIIKILDNSNYKKTKDIFIRKQDIYLIKLLAKRAKANKRNEFLKINEKIKIYKELKLKKTPIINKSNKNNKLEYKNIRIIKKKVGNSINENKYILENAIEESKYNKNTFDFENLITSKIYNSDLSRNNQTILKVKTEDNNINNDINDKNDIEDSLQKEKVKKYRLKDKYNKTATSLFNGKTIYNISNTPNILLPKTIKNRVDENQKKDRLLLFDNFNLDKYYYNKIILTENKNESKTRNIEPYLKLKDRGIQFNKVFNLFQKDKKSKVRRQKIIIKRIFGDNDNSERNNIIKNEHSLNKYNNMTTMDNLNNGLPYINRK